MKLILRTGTVWLALAAPTAPSFAADAGETFQDCDVCPVMVTVPAGSFLMGAEIDEALGEGSPPEWAEDETPVHRVTIAAPFAVARTHVTKAEFRAFVAATGYETGPGCRTYTDGRFQPIDAHSWRDTGTPHGDDHPVHCVSWTDAKAYAAWLAATTGRPYRLLSEAEWEYAARGGTTGPHYWPADANPCDYGAFGDETSHALFADEGLLPGFPCTDGYAKTAPAGSFLPNPFGLYDMLGNAWEWLEDCHNPSYEGAPADGSAWVTGDCDKRALRGGGWEDPPAFTRIANRLAMDKDLRVESGGFRVGLSLD